MDTGVCRFSWNKLLSYNLLGLIFLFQFSNLARYEIALLHKTTIGHYVLTDVLVCSSPTQCEIFAKSKICSYWLFSSPASTANNYENSCKNALKYICQVPAKDIQVNDEILSSSRHSKISSKCIKEILNNKSHPKETINRNRKSQVNIKILSLLKEKPKETINGQRESK